MRFSVELRPPGNQSVGFQNPHKALCFSLPAPHSSFCSPPPAEEPLINYASLIATTFIRRRIFANSIRPRLIRDLTVPSGIFKRSQSPDNSTLRYLEESRRCVDPVKACRCRSAPARPARAVPSPADRIAGRVQVITVVGKIVRVIIVRRALAFAVIIDNQITRQPHQPVLQITLLGVVLIQRTINPNKNFLSQIFGGVGAGSEAVGEVIDAPGVTLDNLLPRPRRRPRDTCEPIRLLRWRPKP